MKRFKYIRHTGSDGLGYQHFMLQCLSVVAKKFGLKVICDLRDWAYFNNKDFDQTIINKMFSFDSTIIHEPSEIDSLNKDTVLQQKSPLREDRRKFLDFIKDIAIDCIEEHKLYIKPKNTDIIKKYKQQVAESIAVHARLGNGETLGQSSRLVNESLDRYNVSHDSFILEMQKHDKNFFVCTDSPDFLDRCREEFGDRVFCVDRIMPEQGNGAGHRDDGENVGLDPYISLHDALNDMILLGNASQLICNPSAFNHYARSKIKTSMLNPPNFRKG